MPHPNILEPKHSALLIIDVQEAFRSVIPDFEVIAVRIAKVLRGFSTLGLPIFVTEQYPKGLGSTCSEVMNAFTENIEVYEKTVFSSCGADSLVEKLKSLDIKQTVICGLETHICVAQTAHDLLEHGFQVHVLCDCVSSRFEYNRLVGLSKMRRSGVIESSTEMALFELLRDAKHAKFKEIQALIK